MTVFPSVKLKLNNCTSRKSVKSTGEARTMKPETLQTCGHVATVPKFPGPKFSKSGPVYVYTASACTNGLRKLRRRPAVECRSAHETNRSEYSCCSPMSRGCSYNTRSRPPKLSHRLCQVSKHVTTHRAEASGKTNERRPGATGPSFRHGGRAGSEPGATGERGPTLSRPESVGHPATGQLSPLGCLRCMWDSSPSGRPRPLVWTFRLLILGAIVAIGILTLFYVTDHKPFATSLLRNSLPLTSVLPWLTQGMRLTMFNARLFDFFIVLTSAFQGLILGAAIDVTRWLRRRPSRARTRQS
jgi:hypothetical protein